MRYILFGFERYYPRGGADDSVKAFDTLEAAIEYTKKENPNDYENYNILDLVTLSSVAYGQWEARNWNDDDDD